MNAFELLLKRRHDNYEAAGKLVRAAYEAGAFRGIQSRQWPEFTAAYWSEPLQESSDRESQLPGTRGGVLWRYFVAMGTWLSLLGRVNNLLGPVACRTVEGLGRTSADLRMTDDDGATGVIQGALSSSSFKEYVRARFGEVTTLRAEEQQLEALLRPSAGIPAAEVVDFLTHLLLQDLEVVDVANLPNTWASLAGLRTDTPSRETLYGLGYDADFLLRALADVAESIASQRRSIRRLATQALESDRVLKSLVLSRLLPFAESNFLFAEQQERRDTAALSVVAVIIEQDRVSRLQLRGEMDLSRVWALGTVATLTERTMQILFRVSVPFLHWCAKSRIPLAHLWNEAAGDVGVWPNFTHGSGTKEYVAIASKVSKGSFRRAVTFLTKTLRRNPEATCLLVTDHWDEEEVAAAYQVVTDRRSTASIAVLRSDGPRYPIAVFEFPGQ